MSNLVLIFFIVFSTFGFAQDKKEVERQFVDYCNLIISKNVVKAVEQYAPKDLLKIVPKDDFIKMMEGVLNNPEMEFKMFQPKGILIKDKGSLKGVRYMNVNYTQQIQMKFKNEIDQNLLLGSLAMEFGDENVNFNEETKFFEIVTIKDCLASS